MTATCYQVPGSSWEKIRNSGYPPAHKVLCFFLAHSGFVGDSWERKCCNYNL